MIYYNNINVPLFISDNSFYILSNLSFSNHHLNCTFYKEKTYMLRFIQYGDVCQENINSEEKYSICEKLIDYTIKVQGKKTRINIEIIIYIVIVIYVLLFIIIFIWVLRKTKYNVIRHRHRILSMSSEKHRDWSPICWLTAIMLFLPGRSCRPSPATTLTPPGTPCRISSAITGAWQMQRSSSYLMLTGWKTIRWKSLITATSMLSSPKQPRPQTPISRNSLTTTGQNTISALSLQTGWNRSSSRGRARDWSPRTNLKTASEKLMKKSAGSLKKTKDQSLPGKWIFPYCRTLNRMNKEWQR